MKSLEERFHAMQKKGTKPVAAANVPEPKRGDAIFENDEGAPRSFDEYVGQTLAKQMLNAAIVSSRARNVLPDHILLASGIPGVGKSALARIVAYSLGLPYIETQGEVSKEQAIGILDKLSNTSPQGAVWFIDELHQLVARQKENAEWLLSLLQDGIILDATEERKYKNIVIIGATTDKSVLPEAILSRFTWQPPFAEYTPDEATQIVEQKAALLLDALPPMPTVTASDIARASAANPRVIKSLLKMLRDAYLADLVPTKDDGSWDISVPLTWSGRDANGLTLMARKIYAALFTAGAFEPKGLGMNNIAGILHEPVYPREDEYILMRLGWLTVSQAGRSLTEEGAAAYQEIGL
jgi:Holliday junction DNA helicase RuvB